jgi:hypothetical protein
MVDAVGARTDRPVLPVHQEPKAHQELKALLAVQEAQAKTETAVHQVPQVPPAMLVHQVDKVRLAMLVKTLLAVKKATLVPLVPPALPAVPAKTPRKEALAETEDPVQLVHPVLLELQALVPVKKDPMAHLVNVVNRAKMPNTARARIAPRPKPPKPKPKRRPRPKPKPRHKPDNDNMVKIYSIFKYFYQHADALYDIFNLWMLWVAVSF